jgi:ribonuclease BN (tRNA processing enzyme)
MMTLTFLGVGDMAARRNHNANALVETWPGRPEDGDPPLDTLLIDFGTTGPAAMHLLKSTPGFEHYRIPPADASTLGVDLADYRRLARIVLTHQHVDHFGGLEDIALVLRFWLAKLGGAVHRPELIASDELLRTLWDGSLRGGLSIGMGAATSLEDFFVPRPVEPGGAVELAGGYRIRLLPADHVRSAGKHDVPAFGVVLESATSARCAFYSGDARVDAVANREWFDRADVIFHDVMLQGPADAVHAPLAELRALPASVRAKMLLYHYADNWDDPRFAFVSEEFAGFAQPRVRYVLAP